MEIFIAPILGLGMFFALFFANAVVAALIFDKDTALLPALIFMTVEFIAWVILT